MRCSLFIAAVWCVFAYGVAARDEEGAVGFSNETTPSAQSENSGDKAPLQDQQAVLPPAAHTPLVPDVISTVQPIDTETSKEDSDDEIQRRDLKAQESMANAAWAMFWSATMQVALGGLSIYLIFLTWRETRRTLTEAEKATKASQDAADAAMKSIEVSRDIADAQVRPWVSVDCRITEGFKFGTTQHGIDGFYLNIHAIAKNHGSSPATNVNFRAEMGIPTAENGDLMANFCDRFRDIPDQTLDAIFPGETKEFSHNVFLPIVDILDHVSEKEFKAVCPIVYGLIHYKSDHTSGIRQTRFQYVLSEIREGEFSVFFPDVDDWPKKNITLTSMGISAD